MNKKSFRYIKFRIVVGLILFASKSIMAQVYPVQVSPNMVPPYSMKLSDYNTATYEKIMVNLLLTDVTELNRQVGIRMYIENGRNIAIQSSPVVSGAMPIYLDGGVPVRLTNLDLQVYFQYENLQGISPQQYNQPLPDGLYQFCFEVYDWASGLPISAKSCATAYLVLNDPPILNFPSRGELVAQKDPQNIIFQWTPRHINATNVQYEFTLTELWDPQMDPQAAFLASRPLYETTTSANTLLYGPAETSLLPDKAYGWRVRAVVTDGISETSIFKNDGYSEIFHFVYTGDCDEPAFVLAESESPTAENIYWQDGGHLKYHIQYRKKALNSTSYNEWFEANAYSTNVTLYNLERGTMYEFRVGGQCNPEGGYSYSQIQEFTTPIDVKSSGYNCGITSEIKITNTKPLPQLFRNEVFTAGDFPVTVKEISGAEGIFSGWGYIVVPYLQDTRIRVQFKGVRINDEYQLINGVVETEYDEEWSGVDDIQDEIEAITGTQENFIETGITPQQLPQDNSNIPDTQIPFENQIIPFNEENIGFNPENEIDFEPANENSIADHLFSGLPDIPEQIENPGISEENEQVELGFKLKELYVYQGENRIAKSGDTLYLVNNRVSVGELLNGNMKTEKSVTYKIDIDPDVHENESLQKGISWFYGGEENNEEIAIAKDEGKIEIVRNLKETDNVINTIVRTREEETSGKNVYVQWVDHDRKTIRVVPRSLQNTAEYIFDNAKKLKEITDKLKIKGWKLEPKIETVGIQYNEEDKVSRFYKTIRKGGINAKIELKKEEIALPYPFSFQLKIPVTGKTVAYLGAYIEVRLELGLKGQLEYERISNEKKFTRTFNNIMLEGKGGVELGAKLESKTDILNIEFKAYGKSALVARGKLAFAGHSDSDAYEFAPQVFLDPLVGGFKGKLKAGSYTVFDNTVEWQLFDRWYWYDGMESNNL